MRKILLAVGVLALSVLACTQAVVVPTVTAIANTSTVLPTVTRTANTPPLATPQPATVVRPVVLVHVAPDAQSAEAGHLEIGDIVNVLECVDDWCKIEQPFGYVFRGCLEEVSDGRGCEAR